MSASGHWVHDLSPFAIRFTETFGIRWYGLAYVAGFLAAGAMLAWYHRRGRCPWNADQRADILLAVIVGVFLGGRLGSMLLYDLDRFLAAPWTIVRVWEGGMASHGGFVGVGLAAWWAARRTGTALGTVTDILATTAPVGILLGRLANFVNGELWGKVSTVPWAVVFPQSAPDQPIALVEPRHPSQLYAAGLEGLVLLAFAQWRFWRGRDLPPGRLTGEFLVAYALLRIAGEVYREPDEGVSLIFGLSRGTAYSIAFLVLGGAIVVASKRTRPRP